MDFFGFGKGKANKGSASKDAGVDMHVWTHIETQSSNDPSGTMMTSETPQAASTRPGGWVHGLTPPDENRLTGGNARAMVCELVFRGDSRSPNDVMQAGGFFPRGGTKWRTVANNNDLDPGRHVGWDSPQTTVFVSCSRSYRVAKGFSGSSYVYLLRVNNGVDIANFGTSTSSMQCEVSALFGIKFQDILGVKVIGSGNVYRNTHFVPAGLTTGQMDAALGWLANGQAIRS